MTAVAVGVDVGGSKIAGALVAVDGTVVREIKVATPRSERGADPAGTATTALVTELVAGGGGSGGHEIVGIGIGVPEYVDPHGRIASSMVLDWDAETLASLTSGLVNSQTPDLIIESDVRCAALAESRVGHGRAATSCLYVSVGTGISHTIVIDGEPWSGRRGEAIAFGELSVSADACLVDEAPLTVEGQASGLTLERVASDLGVSPLATGVTRLDAARRRAGQTIANALAGAVVLFDPAIVVLGGGFGVSTGAFGEAIDEHYAALTTIRPDAPSLVRSALGTRAGVIGAGLVVHERYDCAT